MDNIQDIAISTYLENLEYLQKNHKRLHNKVTELSNMIEDGKYPERYHLEYIKEDDNFDLYDKIKQTYVYDRKPNDFIKSSLKENNFDKKSTFDLLTPSVYNRQQPTPINDNMQLIHKTLGMCYNDIFDYTYIFAKSTAYKKKQFKYIEKFIFVGTLLGIHIPSIINKLKLNFVFIYEYNLEIFRLSLFVTNYAQISKQCELIFSIMEDDFILESNIEQFMNYAFRSNYMIKYYCTNYNIHNFFDRLLNATSKKTPFTFNYHKMFLGLLEPSFKNMKVYPTLNNSNRVEFLSDFPVLIVGAGPSFGKNIEWIKENQNKLFIIAIGATVKKLCDHNIKIDLITSVDSDDIIKRQFPDKIRDQIKNIPFLTIATTHQSVLDMFEKENIILFEGMTTFKKISTLTPGYSVGEVTFNMAYTLGANQIYLLGTDLALDQESGATHIDDYETTIKHEITDEKKEHNAFIKDNCYSFSSSNTSVKGNFRDKVVTTVIFEKSINAYNVILNRIKNNTPNVKVYNLNDGAYFKGAIPTKLNEVVLNQDITIEHINFINQLNSISELGFIDSEIEKFKNSIEVLDNLIEELNSFDKIKIKTYDDFNTKRNPILSMIKKDLQQFDGLYINRIFLNYLFMIEPYIGYQLNEKNLKNEANYIKKVKKVWVKHMLNISNKYKDTVMKLIEN